MDKNVVTEYQGSWQSGVTSAIAPKFVPDGFAVSAINTRFRGGSPHPRCVTYTQNLIFQGDADQDYFADEIYQGGCRYNRPDGDYIVMVIGGRVYSLEPTRESNDWNVYDLTPDYPNNRYAPIAYLCQADRYVVIQDGEHVPIVVDGLTAFRVGGVNPIPIGTVMAYVNNRLWLVVQGNQLVAGDLLNSEDNAVLKFTENLYLNEGGSFSPPGAFGNILSLSAQAFQDTATGQGTLTVGCEYGVFSINGLVPRDQWKNTTIQQITLIDVGFTGHRSACNVNGDLWFLSHDGWRSYRQARAEIQGWNHVPLSNPVRQYVDNDTVENRLYTSAVYWDNRLLVTSGPYVSNNRPANFGLLSLDFHPVSTGFAASAPPAWDGYWTLLGDVCELLTGVFDSRKRCFALCLVNGSNALYEIKADGYADDDTTPISWELDTKKYFFDDPRGAMLKKIVSGGDIRTSDRQGSTTTTIQYRQDDSCQWKDWQTFTETVPAQSCNLSASNCSYSLPACYYSPRNVLGVPGDTKDSVSERFDTDFYDLQCKLKFNGWLKLESLRLQASMPTDKDENPEV